MKYNMLLTITVLYQVYLENTTQDSGYVHIGNLVTQIQTGLRIFKVCLDRRQSFLKFKSQFRNFQTNFSKLTFFLKFVIIIYDKGFKMKKYVIENYLVEYLSGETSFDETVDLIEKEITKSIYEELLKENDINKKARGRFKNCR
jgi:predicted DNA-binding transcriptional regulator